MTPPTNTLTSLSDLAAQANENHQLAESTAGSALEYARKAGASLIEAQALVPYGQWLPWLEVNFAAGYRTAYRYIKLAKDLTCVSNVEPRSINEALRMMAGEDEEEEPEEEIPASFEEALADVQHGRVSPAEELPDEPRAVAVEVVEEDEAEAPAEPSAQSEDSEKDSEKLSLLKSTWTKASKKDKAVFAAWINKNWNP